MSEGEPAYRLAVGYSGKWYDRFGSSIGSILLKKDFERVSEQH